MTATESLRNTFGKLDFWFDESTSGGENHLVGFAPDGRVGIVEVLESDQESRVSLLFSADGGSRDTRAWSWSAVCIASLARSMRVDFGRWLGVEIDRRGLLDPWFTSRQFGSTVVSATFHPLDSVVLTIERGGTSVSRVS